MPRTCGSRPSGPAIVVARSLAIRLLAPDRVPTEVDYSRYTKQAQTGLQDYSRCCPQHVMRLLAPDRVPTEVEYSRYTKQADANDYQQKQMPLSQLFFSDDFKRPWSYSFLGPQTCECERTYGCK